METKICYIKCKNEIECICNKQKEDKEADISHSGFPVPTKQTSNIKSMLIFHIFTKNPQLLKYKYYIYSIEKEKIIKK